MQLPGFKSRPVAHTADGAPVVLERRPGETVEAFEARRAAHTRDHASLEASERVRRDAYAEGRRDQHRIDRAARRPGVGAVLLSAVLVIAAALAVVWTGLAIQHGSFAAGGAVVDQTVARFTQPAKVATNEAVDRTGVAVQSAGQALETQGERLRETAR